ncbi:MAG TPA: prepilin-type N-terminal cleavage/methylation domain-containing protein [Chromatiales bacterium]|nr:prepilin-type N-terminal cleavage/methylation domain-containing protein [Thiotrichales bacterium]HIP69317.1 prepilin-type N-terminal cleavage/methylation domain-containing protein [Chromatiales bacterium]
MNKEIGVTLVELMVVIAIVAITLTIGVPSMRNMIANNRSSSQAINFVASLNLARSEAVKRGSTVSMAATDGANWENGWQIWDDQNGDGNVDAGETILQTSAGLTGGNTLAAGGVTSLTYTSTGRIAAVATFTLDSASGAGYDRTIEIQPTGRVHVFGET